MEMETVGALRRLAERPLQEARMFNGGFGIMYRNFPDLINNRRRQSGEQLSAGPPHERFIPQCRRGAVDLSAGDPGSFFRILSTDRDRGPRESARLSPLPDDIIDFWNQAANFVGRRATPATATRQERQALAQEERNILDETRKETTQPAQQSVAYNLQSRLLRLHGARAHQTTHGCSR